MPKTLEEWQAYIQQLAGGNLRSKGINANTQMFADALLEEGYMMADVEQIVLMFVRQFVVTNQKIPEGGAYNMVAMAAEDTVAHSTMTKEKVDELISNPPVEGQDTVDQALIRAAETDSFG